MEPTGTVDDLFAIFGPLSQFGGFTPPTSSNDILNMTVGEYRALLDLVEQSLAVLRAFDFSAILAAPGVPADARAEYEAFAAGDFSMITGPLDEARAQVAGFSDDTLLRDALNTLDGSGGTVAEIEEAFTAAEAELVDALWTAQDATFTSPLATVRADGSWFLQGGPQGLTYGGDSLVTLFSALGDAVANAVLSFINSDQALLDALLAEGAVAASFDVAQSTTQEAAANALTVLQGLALSLTNGSTVDPEAIQQQAAEQMATLLAGLNAALPGFAGELSSFALGAKNTGRSYVTSFDPVEGSFEGDWLLLSQLADIIDGGVGADVLFGLEGNDNLSGGTEDDHLYGGTGDDALNGGAGDDNLHGGEGTGDSAGFAGGLGQFSLLLNTDGSITVQDRSGTEGTDLVTGMEMLAFGGGIAAFDDGMIDLTRFAGMTGLSPEQIDSFVELYIAYFNRAPDAIGLNFWGTAFATGTTLPEIAALFIGQAETLAAYPPGATNLEFATTVYANVLGRTADQAGLDFWVGQLDAGAVGRDTFILEVLKGAKADPEAGADQAFIDLQLADRAYLAQKTDIGTYYSVTKGLSDVADAAAAMQLFVRGDAASVQSAVDLIDAEYAAAQAADSGELILQLVGVADDLFAV